MPIGATIGAAAIGGGASMYASSKASKAASKASAKDAAIQQQQYEQTRADLAPYTSAGVTANQALMQRLGLTPAASTTQAPANTSVAATGAKTGFAGTSPAVPDTGAGANVFSLSPQSATPATGAGLDLAQVRKDVPGIQSAYEQARATADPNSPVYQQKGLDSLDHYTQYWYDNLRNPADYTAPTAQAQTVAQPAANGTSSIPGQTMTSADNGGLGARPDISRPTFSEAQPGQVDLSAAGFQSSPFYEQGLADTMRNVNAKYGASGLLKSGAGLQGATNAASNNFMANYGNWANQQLGIWNTNLGQYNANRNVFNQNYNTDTSRTDNLFNSDRAYNTDQYNTYTGNLFNLANQGQAAAAGQANAGQNYANQATANNNALASVQGNAAISQANGINNALNNGMQAYGAYSSAATNPFATASATTSGISGSNWLPSGLSF